MREIIVLLLATSLMAFGKPKRKEFRIRVIPKNGFTIYIPEYREKRSLFGRQWWPLSPNVCYGLELAKDMIADARYEDSLRVVHYKDTFIYFDNGRN